jgi:hypothetical protein
VFTQDLHFSLSLTIQIISSPRPPNAFIQIHFNIYLPSMPRSLKCSFYFMFTYVHFSSPSYVPHAPPIISSLVRSTSHKVCHDAIFSILLLPPLSLTQISSSGYVLTSVWEAKTYVQMREKRAVYKITPIRLLQTQADMTCRRTLSRNMTVQPNLQDRGWAACVRLLLPNPLTKRPTSSTTHHYGSAPHCWHQSSAGLLLLGWR